MCKEQFHEEKGLEIKEFGNNVHLRTYGNGEPCLLECIEGTYRDVCQKFHFELQRAHFFQGSKEF